MAWLALLPALVAGCADSASDQPPAAPPPVTSAPMASAGPQVPAEASEFPGGVYRTQLSVERLRAFGVDDPGHAGTWTLTVKDGTFTLECRPVTTPGVDCGGYDPSMPAVVEVGTLRGTGQTVWFVGDVERKMKLSGCVRHSEQADGCGPEDAYHLDWTLAGDGVSFRNYGGLGDQATFPELSNWTAQPWTRIS
ncbi:hypothetical protein ACTMTJ_09395 [Phytohabitans sp. LJ34]|uniref:hypothetical protein n=1 Tax=Phytohabitans sp. LJ34 TaxID=3452217 RepID=UPI003F88A95F